MNNIALQVESVGKLYRLGEVGTGTLSHDLNRWWARLRGKEDPYARVGEENDRTQRGKGDYVWALRDISFDVQRGEVLGIIGRNGAGKSTLLKLLSRVTHPTEGLIKVNGRIASLLEVGTGFHPEMTGRENTFQNGAILGMTRQEIKSKFDEIVDFSGVERYIDTPVKRYSSGMCVRLAFAVAAHLEPEILIVDEVLAVGDAEFQRKCLGKMKDVSVNEGRTVLFVSHNMTALKALCDNAILLSNGGMKSTGPAHTIIGEYLQNFATQNQVFLRDAGFICSNQYFEVESIAMDSDCEIEGAFYINKPLTLTLTFINKSVVAQTTHFNLFFETMDGMVVFLTHFEPRRLARGRFTAVCTIPANFLNDNIYSIRIMGVVDRATPVLEISNALAIEGIEPPREAGWMGKYPGQVRTEFQWQVDSLIR